MKPLSVEIINFGNEILIGRVVNTNASFLAKELTLAGTTVTRITVLSDAFEDLKNGFQEALARRPDVIISTGGLGPTWDDRTAEGLALALDKPLRRNQQAYEMIEKRYNTFNITLNPAGEKMANLPEGSIPLYNSVGTAPGIKYDTGSTIIFCIPGVPAEMKAIFFESILPEVKSRASKTNFYQHQFECYGLGESKLAHITQELTYKHPNVYIKSHPDYKITSEGFQSKIIFHLTAYGDKTVKQELEETVSELKIALRKIGGKIVEIDN